MNDGTKVNLETPLPAFQPQELKLPHERDQSVSPGEAIIVAHAKKAASDAEKGTPDTSRATEAEAAYQRQKQL